MTPAEFKAFYPQFRDVIPARVLRAFVQAANQRFDDFGEDAEEARRLYTAHRLTRYAQTMPASQEAQGGVTSFSALASAGEGRKVISRRVDDVSVGYASGAGNSSSGLTDLAETAYGIQLLLLLRLHALPRYVRG